MNLSGIDKGNNTHGAISAIADRYPRPGRTRLMAVLPVELSALDRHASPAAIERACAEATRRQGLSRAVAVAVDAPNVHQASQLLFGTGVGVVGLVDALEVDADPLLSSRQVLAAGANEIQLGDHFLDPDLTAAIRSAVGDEVALCVTVPLLSGSLDLDGIERAVRSGADFVKLKWPQANQADVTEISRLFELLAGLGRGGAKLAVPDHQVGRVRSLADETFGPFSPSSRTRRHRIRNYRRVDSAWDL